MINRTSTLRRLLAEEHFIDMPVAYDPLGGRLIESLGFKTVYNGGFVTGGSRCTSEPLHTMRTVKEFVHSGVSGIHIEDQLFPKRAHYHKYVAHVIPRNDFVDKIKFACRQRDETDKDFVIIARSDSCRFEGLDEAVTRINMAADAGADMGMIFPRTPEELQQATKLAKVPLVYVRSLGNRDNRPTPSSKQLAEMGYKACIDALLYLLVSFHHAKRALTELKQKGEYSGLSQEDCVAARHEIETLVGLDQFYEVEEQTVEDKKWGDR